jgi:hypothetical protein
LKKIPKEKAFYFFASIGNYTGENASSLEEFSEKVKEIANKSLEFHLYRGDFEKWIREVWGHEKLSKKIGKIKNMNLKGESLCGRIHDTVSNFLEISKRERPKKPKQTQTMNMTEYLKQLPSPPAEHAYELKMEKQLKRMLKKQEKSSQ